MKEPKDLTPEERQELIERLNRDQNRKQTAAIVQGQSGFLRENWRN